MRSTIRDFFCLALRFSFFALPLLALFPAAVAQTYSVLHAFTGGADGAYPGAALTIDRAGSFYGTTERGGRYDNGTVFKFTHNRSGWIFAPLYSFTGGSDGRTPAARVTIGPEGSLYSTTVYGGVGGCGDGCGTVFNLKPPARGCHMALCDWTETVLYRFTGGGDGSDPSGTLVFDSLGNIYGTASCETSHCSGTVYELTPAGGGWSETVLYGFTGGTDGRFPFGGVIFDQVGNLYGTTQEGVAGSLGTVFQLTPSASGWTKTVLHSLSRSDGGFPVGGLIFDNSGNLYGTTPSYGSQGGGTVFRLSPAGGSWMFTVLYSFVCPGCINAPGPQDSLVRDAAGSLYGTTYQDGAYGYGSVFKLTRHPNGSWTYTDLHDFTGGTDGGLPVATVTLDANGNLYGTTSMGGTYNEGVVWKLTP